MVFHLWDMVQTWRVCIRHEVSLSRLPQPSFPGPSLPNTLINEFLQLSGNLPPTIQIPSLVTLIFHTFIYFFFKGLDVVSFITQQAAVSCGRNIACVWCGTDYFAAR